MLADPLMNPFIQVQAVNGSAMKGQRDPLESYSKAESTRRVRGCKRGSERVLRPDVGGHLPNGKTPLLVLLANAEPR